MNQYDDGGLPGERCEHKNCPVNCHLGCPECQPEEEKGGGKRTALDLIADGFGGVVFLDPKGGASSAPAQRRPSDDPYSAGGDDGSREDCPF